MLISNEDGVRKVFEQLNEKGFKFAIDDFGTGYLFSKPVGISKFDELLRLGKCFPVVNGKEMEVLIEDKRQFFRIDFKHPLKSEMTVLKISKKPVLVGSTDVLIEEITAGGIRFLSKIKLSEQNGVLIVVLSQLVKKNISRK